MRVIKVLAASISALLLAAPAASAAAPERETFTLDCDNGQTLAVSVNPGQGDFTPARVIGTNRMLIPVGFGEFHFSATAPDGEVLFEGTEPPMTKGQVAAHNPREMITCSFSETFVLPEDDTESGLPAGTTLTFSAEVTGFLTRS